MGALGLEASNDTHFAYGLLAQVQTQGLKGQRRVVDSSNKTTKTVHSTFIQGRENLVVIHSRRARLSTHRVLVWLFGSWDGWAI
jgi:hypothetical protein